MKPSEAQALLTNLLSEAEQASRIAQTASGAKKSIRGDGEYARKFHEAVVTMATTEGKLRHGLKALGLPDEDEQRFGWLLMRIKEEHVKQRERSAHLKELRLLCETNIRPWLDGLKPSPVPATEQVLPLSVVESTRRNYIIHIVVQANGSYERQWFDACAVMVRRLVETLLIEAYEAKGEAEEIKKLDGDFLMLGPMIDNTLVNKGAWNLGRETRRTLPLLKSVGDRSAHTRRYLAKKEDIDKITHGLRAVVDDLLHLASLK